ncbi:M23 family metallopeptidase [uncultured Kordia sp.]|uniref:M23 family metallopeptidase n=1 Tax=uncultured Kordia sp. TaxID=507699 RepID=UPI00260629C4|nr:M23 family metallopeptidase [uncultured Kordia sp.]
MNKVLIISFLTLAFAKGCKPENIQPNEVNFLSERKQDSTYVHIVSNSFAPMEISVGLKNGELKNIHIKNHGLLKSKDTLFKVIIVPNTVIDSIGETKLLRKHITAKFDYGDSKTAVHNDAYVYSLPVAIGKKVRISQGFNGKKSHSSIASKYAIDFDIPVGTEIYAAREGIVVYTITGYKKAGGKAYVKKANKILILHDDGTFAAYSHLMYNGALVKKGDTVQRGQLIGYSGNTGYSSGPHLHFAVRLPKDICVPIYFEGYENKALKKGDHVKRIKIQ